MPIHELNHGITYEQFADFNARLAKQQERLGLDDFGQKRAVKSPDVESAEINSRRDPSGKHNPQES